MVGADSNMQVSSINDNLTNLSNNYPVQSTNNLSFGSYTVCYDTFNSNSKKQKMSFAGKSELQRDLIKGALGVRFCLVDLPRLITLNMAEDTVKNPGLKNLFRKINNSLDIKAGELYYKLLTK